MLVAMTGVSGSGKSTLLHDVLYQALAPAKKQANGGDRSGSRAWDCIEGRRIIDEVVLVDQSPIGRTPRSNPVTYIKAFDAIRELFASLPEAQEARLQLRAFFIQCSGRTLRNLPGRRHGNGRDAVPGGRGTDCEECKGTRYKSQVLEVVRGKNIHEVLNLTVKEALKFFCRGAEDYRKLRVLEEVGWAICAWDSRRPRSPAAKRSA